MTDPSAASHDSLADDSWFDRPAGGKTRRAVTRAEVFAALEKAGREVDAPPDAASWAGLDDSWFDRPARRR